jgi:hypothetical protein
LWEIGKAESFGAGDVRRIAGMSKPRTRVQETFESETRTEDLVPVEDEALEIPMMLRMRGLHKFF